MKPIILDTDIGGDCDDAGALTLLNRLCDRGEADLKAVTVDTSCKAAPYCAAAINAYHGRMPPVGQVDFDTRYDDIYATAVCEKYAPHLRVENGVRVLRKTVAENAGVTIVGIGNLGLLRAFMLAPADDVSPMTGQELIARNVAETVLMAGYFDRSTDIDIGGAVMTAECNVVFDVAAAQEVNENWNGPITYSPFELGYYVMTGKRFAAKYPDHPMALSYRLSVGGDNRCSWDPSAVLYAVRGAGECFTVKTGDVRISDAGVTDFVERAGGRRRLMTAKLPHKKIAEYIDDLLDGL